MLSALLYLRLTSFRNWLLSRLRSLRRPKQLAGALMFALYFWFFFLRHWDGDGRPADLPRHAAGHALAAAQVTAALPTDWLPIAGAFGATIFFVFIVALWIVPTQRAALGFSEAEIAFLFPAPIARRSLVHFRLLSAQFRSLFGALVMMLISNRWTFLGGNALTHALGWWFVFSALNLHFHGASFTLTRLSDAGLRVGRRRLLLALFVAAVVGLTLWRVPAPSRFLEATGPASAELLGKWFTAFAGTAPLSWILWPFRFVLGPFFAPDLRSFALALGPALLVIVAHYLWVVRTAVAFEEASLEHAQKRTARIAAWRSGQRRFGHRAPTAQREPFLLTSTGRPEFAFFWKNLLSTWPYFNLRVFAGCALVLAAACLGLHSNSAWRAVLPVVGWSAAAVGVYTLVIGPQFARQDIRSDLTHADILKTYPLPGWQIVLGQLLTPIAILTGAVWLALLAFTLTFFPPQGHFPLSARLGLAFWLAISTPILVTLQLLVPNAAALVFPAWFQVSRGHGGGPEVAGQRMLFFFAQALTMVLALLPPAGIAFAVAMISTYVLDLSFAIAIHLAAAPFLAVLLGEVWCGVWLLGQRFERFDLSSELRA